MRRHFDLSADEIKLVQELAWGPLRLYLGRRYFERAIPPVPEMNRRPSRQADRMGLLSAVAAGNLESVLDEQIFASRRIGALKNDSASDALDELKKNLSLPAGSLSLHHVVRGRRKIRGKLRAHAAVAFAGQESSGTRASRTELRPAALRGAFNSPFWPHLLATTAVGQEGLDFHLWCKRIVHWDIPPDPLALEQREGRIMRYACLSVRRSLAKQHGPKLLSSKNWNLDSPWLTLGSVVDDIHTTEEHQGESGLTPWWVTKYGTYERTIPTMVLSRDEARFQKLLTELDLYRLAIGQPNPEQFISRVDGKLTPEELRNFAVDLSSTRLRSTRHTALAARK
jgi:hypothetical protein